MDKSYIFLKSPIGSGGEANIYDVRIKPELVAKVYHQPHGDYARKLAFMVANPPVDPLASSGRVSIAWATELVTDLDRVVGFLMPKLDTSKAKPIFQYYNPSTRRKESPTFSYVYLLRTARNLAVAFKSVHARGYVIGDVNESNVLVAEDAIVTLVDTDSFQVNDGTTVYRCTVGKPEYTPPELQGLSFRDVDRSFEHDLFGLGVLIFQLLMEGTHPFGGVFTSKGEVPELKDRIKAGHFPHGKRRVPYKPMPHAPSFRILPLSLQELFLLCFEEGNQNPSLRPTADIWRDVLGEFEKNLIQCSINEQHHYSNHLSDCPWCERTTKLGGRDPFPPKQNLRNSSILINSIISEEVIDLGNGLTIQFVNIPAGSFMMGGNGHSREKPIHQVNLKAFKMGKYPITEEQYQAIMGHNPSYNRISWQMRHDSSLVNVLNAEIERSKKCPVTNVSWHDAVNFCKNLSKMIGQTVKLPSESQWEYACRAGSNTAYFFGDNSKELNLYAWYYDRFPRDPEACTYPVGQKRPNAWGLYDMLGNAWEWCEDVSHRTYKGAPNDGSAWLEGVCQTTRAIRGGCAFLHYSSEYYRSAYRKFSNANRNTDNVYKYLGFRIVII
jgi:formylglycine-generating enzyme required for sulfatase activity